MMTMTHKRGDKVSGASLRRERERRKLTQGQAANLVGVSIRSWNGFENDSGHPSRQTAILLRLFLERKL